MSKLVLDFTPLVAVQAWEGFFSGLRLRELACRIFHGIHRFGDYRCFGLTVWLMILSSLASFAIELDGPIFLIPGITCILNSAQRLQHVVQRLRPAEGRDDPAPGQ